MVFREPSDVGPKIILSTPSAANIFKNLDLFLRKWKDHKHEQDDILPSAAIHEISKLRIHVGKGCLSDIPPSGGTNRNEALHKTLRKSISRQRIGVQLAIALLGITFYIWNEKRESSTLVNKSCNRSIQSYYASFLNTGKTPTTERFGISDAEKITLLSKHANDVEPHSREVADSLEEILNHNIEEDGTASSKSDSDSADEQFPDHFFATATSIFNKALLKMHVVSDLSKKTNNKPEVLAKNVHFMKSALLLLSNFQFKPKEEAGAKVDALLKAHGFKRLPIAKDGNCLFASISIFLMQVLTSVDCSPELREHLNSLGVSSNNTLAEIITFLRKLVVNEFLNGNHQEYSSFLLSTERASYEETARNFECDGFFDCELGNAVILALSNILHMSLVVFTSLENYPIITIVPTTGPISNTPVHHLV